jgi:enamine deaminase RidA (YjgF/YER057c/UK114 family)
VTGDFVTITGLTSRDEKGQVAPTGQSYEQARVVFGRMQALIEAAGGNMSDIIKLNCYLTDIRHREGFVRAREEFFSGDFPPCVVIGGVAFTVPEILVEVDALAILGSEE